MCIRPAWPNLSAQAASAAFNPAAVRKVWYTDGSSPEMSSQKNRPAATRLPTSRASDAGWTPDASMIIAVMNRSRNRGERRMVVHGHVQDQQRSRKTAPSSPFRPPQIPAVIRSLQAKDRAILKPRRRECGGARARAIDQAKHNALQGPSIVVHPCFVHHRWRCGGSHSRPVDLVSDTASATVDPGRGGCDAA